MSNRDISTIKHQCPRGLRCLRKTLHHNSFSLLGNVVSDHNAVNDAAGKVVGDSPLGGQSHEGTAIHGLRGLVAHGLER